MASAPNSGGPDWSMVGGTLATVAGGLATIVVTVKGVLDRSKKNRDPYVQEQERLRTQRDKDASAYTALTLAGVSRLVDDLQEEVARKSAELQAASRSCDERQAGLLVRIGELERELQQLRHPHPQEAP